MVPKESQPKQAVESAERFPEGSLQQLIAEDKAFNTPNWLRGYGANKEISPASLLNKSNKYENR